MLREGIKRGRKAATAQAGKSGWIQTVHLLQMLEMQMMKERMDVMMNALRGRVSSDLDELVHRMNSPFTAPVTSFPFPPKFNMP